MSAKTNHVRIGIFVLLAVFLFIAGLMAFGARSYFAKKVTFETAIEGEIYGLSIGSRVELRGVPIGNISRIDFAPNVYPETKSDVIVVEFEVDRQIYADATSATTRQSRLDSEVSKGLRALIKSQGVTGTSTLALEYIDPKDNPPPQLDYKPRYLYVPSAPGQFTRMLASIEKALDNVEKLDVAGIGASVSNVLVSAARLTDKVGEIDFQGVTSNANSLLVELKASVGEITSTVQNMQLDTVSTNADSLLVSLRQSNEKLQAVLDRVSAAPLQETVSDVRQAVQTLNDVLLELKQYPSGFIFGKPPLPAKSVETPVK